MPAKLNQEQVIARFREVHGDWYDYSQVVYTNAHGKITIICPEHGPFQQPAHGHWQGNGCRACGYLTVGDTPSWGAYRRRRRTFTGETRPR